MKRIKSSHLRYRGLPIVLSAPSAGGKSTIAERVIQGRKNCVRSVSCTTRARRRGEKNGADYYFLSPQEFKKKIDRKEFLEWARVHEHCYGTPISFVTSQMKKGKDVLLVIDPQGAVSIRKVFPQGVFIFIVPPTWKDLEKRLRRRMTDDRHAIKVRLLNAKKELSYLPKYDYLIVNDKLDRAVKEVISIIRAEHLRLTRLEKKGIPILSGT